MRYKNSHWNADYSSKKEFKSSQEAWTHICEVMRPKNPKKIFSFYKCNKCRNWHVGVDKDRTKEYLSNNDE